MSTIKQESTRRGSPAAEKRLRLAAARSILDLEVPGWRDWDPGYTPTVSGPESCPNFRDVQDALDIIGRRFYDGKCIRNEDRRPPKPAQKRLPIASTGEEL